jgi:hypothetical protein
MSLTVKDKGSFIPAPEGLHIARCQGVVDLGKQLNKNTVPTYLKHAFAGSSAMPLCPMASRLSRCSPIALLSVNIHGCGLYWNLGGANPSLTKSAEKNMTGNWNQNTLVVSPQLAWVKLNRYCEISGDTPEAVRAKRKKGGGGTACNAK